MFRERILDIS
jgi:hypothetical protein